MQEFCSLRLPRRDDPSMEIDLGLAATTLSTSGISLGVGCQNFSIAWADKQRLTYRHCIPTLVGYWGHSTFPSLQLSKILSTSPDLISTVDSSRYQRISPKNKSYSASENMLTVRKSNEIRMLTFCLYCAV